MKAFTPKTASIWQNKVNFVDDNNVLVGYDLSQNCCENAGWFISDTQPVDDDWLPEKQEQPDELPGFNFDPEFRYTLDSKGVYNDENFTVFRLVNAETKQEKFLCLYNVHNGYYSHGFDFEVPGLVSESGSL
jgi:hypothetical protein